MQKFVRLEGYPHDYFMVVKSVDELPQDIESVMSERMRSTVGNELTSPKEYPADMFFERYHYVCHNSVDYRKILEKYSYLNPVLLIRQIGSFMLLNEDHKIVDTIYSHDFPDVNDGAPIVVCENDSDPEPIWMNYLQKKFPGEKIRVLNFFNTRSEESLRKSLKNVKYITFSTTFTSLEWFEKITRCVSDGQKIVGFSHVPERWDEVRRLASGLDLTVVETLK